MQSLNKRVALGGGGGWSPWESLSPDILSLILSKLPTEDLLGPVPLVCRSWRDALSDPCCWADIDIERWGRKVRDTERVDAAVLDLVARAGAMHHRVNAYRVGNLGFEVAVSSGRFLKVLQIRMSDVSDQMVVRHAASLTNLTKLDISFCLNISSEGIEVFGKHCKSLVYLRRTMPPAHLDPYTGIVIVDEEEAFAIANSMPRIEYLELVYARFSDQGLDAILRNCGALSHLDIRGCWNVKMEGDIRNRCKSIRRFSDPWENEFGNFTSHGWVNEEDVRDDQAAFGYVYRSDVDWSENESDMDEGSGKEDVNNNGDQAAVTHPDQCDVDWSEIESDDEDGDNNADRPAIVELDLSEIVDLSEIEADDEDVNHTAAQATIGEAVCLDIDSDTDVAVWSDAEGGTIDNPIIVDADNNDDEDAIALVDLSEIDDELKSDDQGDNVGNYAPTVYLDDDSSGGAYDDQIVLK